MTRSVRPSVSMQRFLVAAKPREIVDHIDRDPLNNTLGNLRVVTKQENAMNAGVRSDNSTGYKGVSYHKRSGKYRAYIAINGKQKHLGLYTSADDAARAYATAARSYFGEYAAALPWAPGLPLGADGWIGDFYKKD